MSLVYIIEDEPVFADVLGTIVRGMPGQVDAEIFDNAVSAIAAVNEQLPDAILLDVLLTGPDGFAFLNELASYQDTAKIPVVLMSSLDLTGQDLSHYGVIAVLDKSTMTPEDIQGALQKVLPDPTNTSNVSEPVVAEIATPEDLAAGQLPPVQLPPTEGGYAG